MNRSLLDSSEGFSWWWCISFTALSLFFLLFFFSFGGIPGFSFFRKLNIAQENPL